MRAGYHNKVPTWLRSARDFRKFAMFFEIFSRTKNLRLLGHFLVRQKGSLFDNNIPEISNEQCNFDDRFNEPSCSYNGWQRTAK